MLVTFKEKLARILFVALVVAIGMLLIARIPIIGGIIISIAGIPMSSISLTWGIQWFLLYSCLSIAMVALSNMPLAIAFLPLVILPSVILAFFIKQKQKPLTVWFKTVTLVSLIVLSILLVSNLLFSNKDSANFSPFQRHLSQQMLIVEGQLDKFEKTNKSQLEEIELARKNLKAWFNYMKLLAPVTFVFVWYFVSVYLAYVGMVKFSKHFAFKLESFPPFSEWRFDWRLIWLFISGWVTFNLGNTTFIGSQFKGILLLVGANCLAISNLLFFIAGFSLLFFMFDKYKLGSFSKILFAFIALILSQAVIWFGIINVWVDFRTPKSVTLVSDKSSG